MDSKAQGNNIDTKALKNTLEGIVSALKAGEKREVEFLYQYGDPIIFDVERSQDGSLHITSGYEFMQIADQAQFQAVQATVDGVVAEVIGENKAKNTIYQASDMNPKVRPSQYGGLFAIHGSARSTPEPENKPDTPGLGGKKD